MGDYIELSDKTKAVCNAYYQTKCGDCPLRQKCVERYPTTREAINKNTREINELAETVELQKRSCCKWS